MILSKEDRLAKEILHVTRAEFTNWLWSMPTKQPLSTQFALFMINRQKMHNDLISNEEPESIKMVLDSFL